MILFMKFIFLQILLFGHFSLALYGQVAIKGRWNLEAGLSTSNAFQKSSSFNLRYISPRFNWSEEELEGDEKKLDEFKNMRLMAELIYTPPFNVLCTGFNAQCRFMHYKRLSVEIYGGMKFFLITGPDFVVPNRGNSSRGDVWYLNLGLQCQVNLGIIAPFVDFGGDKILTIGTEVNFRSKYKKPKKRYNIHSRKVTQ